MKISRSRKVQRTLSFYANNFGFRQPYQMLIDGTLCYFALKNKVNLQEQLPKYCGAEIKLLTTQCIILETEKLGSALFGAMLIAKQFPVHQCGHGTNPVSGSECILSMLGKKNKNRYIVATQDRELQEQVRLIPGAPLLFIHQRAPTLDVPSKASLRSAEKINEAKFDATQQPGENVFEIRRKVLGEEEKTEVRKHRRKKPSGPNPLSCKKKKKKTQSAANSSQIGDASKNRKCRTRKRIKVPQHVKELLQSK